MTWSARVTDKLGKVNGKDHFACQSCLHGQYDHQTGNETGGNKMIQPCFIPKVAYQVGSLLTCVDVGADGHMASGDALLKCNGYKPREESPLQDFQERVVVEKEDLDERLTKLVAIFDTSKFSEMDSAEQERLKRQSIIMTEYSVVLGERIAAF